MDTDLSLFKRVSKLDPFLFLNGHSTYFGHLLDIDFSMCFSSLCVRLEHRKEEDSPGVHIVNNSIQYSPDIVLLAGETFQYCVWCSLSHYCV